MEKGFWGHTRSQTSFLKDAGGEKTSNFAVGLRELATPHNLNIEVSCRKHFVNPAYSLLGVRADLAWIR